MEKNLCSCGYDHNPLWKPLFWKLYSCYIPLEDFKKDYPELAEIIQRTKEVKSKHYLYKLAGKTRRVVHRIHLAHVHLADRKLYEKTPSERRKPKYAKLF